MSTVLGLPTAIPYGPFLSPGTVEDTKSRSASPCPSESGSSYRSSESGSSDKSSPSGLYVPVHRRGRASSSSASSVSSSATSSKTCRTNSNSRLGTKPKLQPQPHPRGYTRAELLSLAPASLVQTSVHPIITPQLLARHPRILRARGDGVARALEMSRQDYYYFAFARANVNVNVNAKTNVNVDANVDVSVRVGTQTHLQAGHADAHAHARVLEVAQLPKTESSSSLAPCAPYTPTPMPNRPSRRSRGGRRRAHYQRNFALITNSKAENANNADTSANTNKTGNAKLSTTDGRRQLDVSVLTSWRVPQTRVVVV